MTRQTEPTAPSTRDRSSREPGKDETIRAGQGEAVAEAARDNSAAALLPSDPWLRASQVATVGLFVIALLWAAYVAQPVVVPVVLAWTIATIVLPVVTWMQGYRIPRPIGVVLVTLALVAIIATFLLLLSTPVAYWLGRASELGALMKQRMQMMSPAENTHDGGILPA